MRSNTARLALGLALVVVAIGLLFVLKDDGGDEETSAAGRDQTPKTRTESKEKPAPPPFPVIVVEGGEPVGGVLTLDYRAGDRIRFEVRSNVADEVHLHGYDLTEEVKAGGTASFDFPATIEGLFEAELEQRGEKILELRVNP